MTSSRARLRSTAGVLALLATLTATGCSSDDSADAAEASTASGAAEREYDISAVRPVLEAFVAEHDLNGAGLVVVQEDDGIVGEEYVGEFDADRVSLVASASKMVTAGVLVRLADQDLLDLDQPIAEYVDWAAGQNPGVTVAQLLSSSSGFVGLLPSPAYGPYVCQFLPAGELEQCGTGAWTTPADDADIAPPDTEWRYGGVQWQIAGAVAETVSGRTWAELLEETYVEPCGVDSLGYNNHWTQIGEGLSGYPAEFGGDPGVLAPTENPSMEGGLYIDPVDYAELLLMQLRGGRCGDTQVLEPESVERMHTDRIGEVFGGTTLTGTGYGLGWWVDRDGSNRINDPGAYGAVPWLDLDGGFGAFLVLEADAQLGVTLAAQLYDPVEAAVTAAR
ncbi:beta-lactamase family protein [Blastococcus sp. TML/M2B]|uniref:serine hydrolase domain-containing protein n=1 Tax=unclassified Blastococcus TaxID=2619396 RepID=UPI001909E2E9|nr:MULTISPECIES: serine hydrolase domain-containing protein [unclassified Blastococcus]MBN1091514.1 beta-lactamase family protein [Blastococcus sp. TML/M2B]MBN1094937.1 beta-lactamase family protein [Blastococcus sp. TML/C7B]